MNHRRTPDRIEQALRRPPAMRPAPERLGPAVMAAISNRPQPARRPGGPPPFRALAAAACVALMGSAATVIVLRQPVPVGPPVATAAARRSLGPIVDPAPVILPAAGFVASSLDRPLTSEARSVLEDTRRAADMVVSCLPFAGG